MLCGLSARYASGLEELEWIHELYLSEVRYVDVEVGRLIDAVAEGEHARETLIVLTSDHGEEFWEHGGYEHGHSLRREVIHVPLILSLPGRLPPQTLKQDVSVVSIYPTLLQLLDIPYDSRDFTASSLPLVSESSSKESVFSAGILYGKYREAVTRAHWKYIQKS